MMHNFLERFRFYRVGSRFEYLRKILSEFTLESRQPKKIMFELIVLNAKTIPNELFKGCKARKPNRKLKCYFESFLMKQS